MNLQHYLVMPLTHSVGAYVDLHTSVHLYVGKSCLRNTSYTKNWIMTKLSQMVDLYV